MMANYLLTPKLPRYVVFESDDWGSIRTSNRASFDKLISKGYKMHKSQYSYDCIETPTDLNRLAAVLSNFKDSRGNKPVFTANVVMANPDFMQIADTGFHKYSYTAVKDETFLFDGRTLVDAWLKTARQGVFFPQLHCREHVQWWPWLEGLRAGASDAVETFSLNMCGVPKAASSSAVSYFEPVYVEDKYTRANKEAIPNAISEGCDIFKATFGYTSRTTVAPVVFWNEIAECTWHEAGIEAIQGSWLQNTKIDNNITFTSRKLGEKNKFGQKYLVRNCNFEPRRGADADSCLREIARAFQFNCPAIICSHRVNYVNSIDGVGAYQSLQQLEKLLETIISRWPDVQFINSQALSEILDIYD